MSGPKHLWSGDWESESRQPAAQQPSAPAQEPEPEPAPPAARGRFTRQQFAIALGTGVATAAVAITLIVTLGGGHKPLAHHNANGVRTAPTAPTQQPQGSGGGGLNSPAQPCQQTAAGCAKTTVARPLISGPSAEWMGMQIVTSPSGVVVDTVKVGSPADIAGFEPGDQIMSIDTHVIGTVSELKTDTAGLKIGAKVTFAVLRQSVQLTFASIPMTQRPTIHP